MQSEIKALEANDTWTLNFYLLENGYWMQMNL